MPDFLTFREQDVTHSTAMLIKSLKSKIHRATLTKTDINYEGSIGIDWTLADAAGLQENEAVHVWNLNNGARLETYVIKAPAGSGEIFLNGAAAPLGQVGDLVIIAAFCWQDAKEAIKPKVVLVDAKNRIKS
jgi:aspartate 1-decarboxylase